jgi:hypothetical protein
VLDIKLFSGEKQPGNKLFSGNKPGNQLFSGNKPGNQLFSGNT